jgi:undecaprenyl-diphosphatase
MNVLSAVFLGIVQGLTEFLPVSSSGHLVLFQNLLPGFKQPGILFDVLLHLATLFAVVFYFRRRILELRFNDLKYLAIGTLPAVFVGVFFQDAVETMFATSKFLGLQFLFSGLLNLLIDRAPLGKKGITSKNSLIIGMAQALAIVPAISRSGATIWAGVTQRVEPKKAVEYSFLLSVPAILGANILQIASHGLTQEVLSFSYLAGFLAAFLAGFLAIKITLQFLLNRRFKFFAYYCFALGILTILV